MYPQTILDEIRDRLSIAALIGERIPLKKAGRNYKGLCPFHHEKTPSFMVSEEKQIYHCFGCGEGGNVFAFFMKHDGLSFKETVEALAARAGVQLPKLTPTQAREGDKADIKKKMAFRVNEIAAQYFYDNIRDEKKGDDARNYLKSRDIFLEKNTQHFLGYAEDSWDGLVRHLEEKKVPLELAAELGLVKKRESGGYYDFFRHRIIFPVMTPGFGNNKVKIAAFSGRTFGSPKTAEGKEAPAKYLNSPDSVIYHKSYTLYGFSAALEEIRRKDQVILVEGNLDVVRLHQGGIKNVVAPLGTALTSGHLKLLSRFTKNFIVIFDGDEAGQKAAIRSLPQFLETGLVPKVVGLTAGEDPDSFVRKNGAAEFEKLLEKAKPLFEWVIDAAVKKFGNTTDGKVGVVEEMKPLFAIITNPVESASYKKYLASRLLLDESVIGRSLLQNAKVVRTGTVKVASDWTAQRVLLEIILSYPDIIAHVAKEMDATYFEDGSCQAIAKLVFDSYREKGKVDVAGLAEELGDAGLRSEILSLAMAEDKYEKPLEAAIGCMTTVKRYGIKRRIQELTEAIQRSPDDPRLNEYMMQIQNLTKEIHNIKG